jgi:hypothetical protein
MRKTLREMHFVELHDSSQSVIWGVFGGGREDNPVKAVSTGHINGAWEPFVINEPRSYSKGPNSSCTLNKQTILYGNKAGM